MMNDVFDRYLDEEFGGFDGERGYRSLERLVTALGYGHGRMRGRALEEFLTDNPGAIEALVDWIGCQVEPGSEWEEGLRNELVEEDEA